jgi:hypothetical protein
LETGRNALRDKLVCDIFYLDGSTPQLGKRPLWQWLVDAVPDNKPLGKYQQVQGYTPEHVKLNGHCLTLRTFRNANTVQSFAVHLATDMTLDDHLVPIRIALLGNIKIFL